MGQIVLCKKCGVFANTIEPVTICPICGNELSFPAMSYEQYHNMTYLERDVYPFMVQAASKYDPESWEKKKLHEARTWCYAHGLDDEPEAPEKDDDKGSGFFFGFNIPI